MLLASATTGPGPAGQGPVPRRSALRFPSETVPPAAPAERRPPFPLDFLFLSVLLLVSVFLLM